MNPLIHSKNATPLILIALLLACLALSPVARAVVPAPDGGYPGQNTAEGQSALLHLAGGTYNTAVGWSSLGFNVTGNYNTAIGAGALLANTADENTATGTGALLSNTTGASNTANGAFALFSNTTGSANTATGWTALNKNTTGSANTATGNSALNNNSTGDSNTAIGLVALLGNSTGSDNTAIGDSALRSNTTGNKNTAIGKYALSDNTTGFNNIAVGYNAGAGVTSAHNRICIGSNNGADVSNSCYIDNIWNQLGGSQAVYVNAEGKLGAQVSSRRFKDEIKPMEQTSEVIYGLKPVSFRYKPEIEPTRPIGFGLIAEDVEKISADLVTRGGDGKVNSVRYDQVNAMLLNEFLKEHKKVEEQQATIAELKSTVAQQQKGFESKLTTQEKQIEALTAGLQKVSAQVELNKPAPQTVKNND